MKKTITIVLILFVVLVGQAQSHICRVDTTLNYRYIVGTSAKELTGRLINQYNSSNKKTQEFSQLWSSTTMVYTDNSRSIWSYDVNGNQIEKVSQLWNASQWENSSRTFWTYDANNRYTEEVRQTWNSTIGWVSVRKYNVIYNTNGNVAQFIEYNWNTSFNSWVAFSRNNYVYNSTNKIIERVTQQWSTSTSVWINSDKLTYTYDALGYESEMLWQKWNSTTFAWDNFRKYNKDYNTSGKKIEEIDASWNATTSMWIGTIKTNLIYNANQDIIEIQKQYFTGTSWENSEKETFEYNASNNLVAYEYSYDWNSAGQYYETRTRSEHKCRLLPNGISEIDNQALILYPNPLNSNVLNITLAEPEELWIMNMQGKVVYKNELSRGENQLELSQLQNGLYIVKAGNSVQKLIKE